MLTSSLLRRTGLLAAVLAGFTLPAGAQGPTTGGPAPAPTGTPTDIPLDGGATLLLVAGAAYGLQRLKRPAKASNAQ